MDGRKPDGDAVTNGVEGGERGDSRGSPLGLAGPVQAASPTSAGTDFARVERDHVRGRFFPAFEWQAYDAFSPLNPLRVPLARARVAFVTTAGAHLAEQPPFDVRAPAGDASYRAIPSATPLGSVQLSHPGYDTRQASADKNVVLPLDHLRAAAEMGRIGELAPWVYSFMGYIADPDPLLRGSAPEVAGRLRADKVDLVLLAPT